MPISAVSAQQFVGLHTQMNEIIRRVGNGSLDFSAVKRSLQDIIEGKLPQMRNWNPPSWWRTAEQQLDYARQLWPRLAFPELPKEFTPRTKSEVLLLHVPEAFDGLWNKVDAPEGYTKWRSGRIKDKEKSLSLAPNKVEYTEPVWLGFDPEYGKGIAPNQLWGQPNLAASEVLSALIQFPDWSLSWFNGASAPNLAGYQIGAGWSSVPYLGRWGGGRQLGLGDVWAGSALGDWASPSVREC